MRIKSIDLDHPHRFQGLDYMKRIVISAVITLCTTTAGIGFAEDSVVITKPVAKIELVEVSSEASTNNTKNDFSSNIQANKSYLIPAVEIIGFDVDRKSTRLNSSHLVI